MLSLQEQAEKSLRMVRGAKRIVFDVETSGLDWKRNFPVGWVIGDSPQDCVYVPTRHGGGGNLPDPSFFHRPTSAIDSYTPHSYEVELAKAFKYRNDNNVGVVIGHHIKFDCHMAANVGVMLGRNLSCTMNNQALIDEYTQSFALEALANKYKVTSKLGQDAYNHLSAKFGCKANKNSMGDFWRLSGDDPVAVSYSAGDGVSTLELFDAQMAEIARQNAEQALYDRSDAHNLSTVLELENALIWTLFRVERRGMRVSIPALEKMLVDVQKRVDDAYTVLPPGFNPRSPKQVLEYVSQYANNWPLTEIGNPSFPEEWLETFPEGKNVVAVRKWTNLANTFITPMMEVHSFNGRVHATLNQNKGDDYGTVSGRLSCSNPNLQQVPKHDRELAEMFRAGFLADEGMVLDEGDYSQMEPRMFAHYSREPALLDGYSATPPVDVHTVVARLFNRDRNTTAKRMNMGMFTGQFPKSFAGHMGIPLDEATDLWNKWFEFFPGIKDFQETAKNVMLERGYVKSILGRRGRIESRRLAYKATSRVIQNGAADIIKYKMLEIDKEYEAQGDTSNLLMSVHDSFIWQRPDNDYGLKVRDWTIHTMCNLQVEPFKMRLPFAVDAGSGKDWAIASFGGKK